MDQQKLPNVTIAIVLGILSYICCCFSAGIGGILFSGIAFYLVRKDEKLYMENPEGYSNFGSLKTAKILAIIGLVLGALALIMVIIQVVSAGGWDGYLEEMCRTYDEAGIEMPFCE